MQFAQGGCHGEDCEGGGGGRWEHVIKFGGNFQTWLNAEDPDKSKGFVQKTCLGNPFNIIQEKRILVITRTLGLYKYEINALIFKWTAWLPKSIKK